MPTEPDPKTHKYANIKVAKKSDSEIDITGEMPAESLGQYRKRALNELGLTLNVPGFRKGHIPEKVIIDRVGDLSVLEDAAEMALRDIVPEIIEKNASSYIGRPDISITKLAPGNPVEFKISLTILPDFDLPDYKKIARDQMAVPDEKIEVTDKEIDEVIAEIRKQRAHQAFHEEDAAAKKTKDQEETGQKNKADHENEPGPENKNGHEHAPGHDHDEKDLEKHLPEFNDDFVKTLGDFSSVADFRAKAKDNLTKEKSHRQMEKKRIKMLEALVEKTRVKIPKILIDNELDRTMDRFEADIKNLGMKIEDYLKHIKKTPEDLRKEWLPDAEKRAKLNIILEKIAAVEKLVPDKEIVDHEVEHLKEHYKDVDPIRIKLYVEYTLTLEKVIQFLEKQN
jgi:trigger factor